MLTATEHKRYGFKGLHVLNTSYNFETKNDIVSKYIFLEILAVYQQLKLKQMQCVFNIILEFLLSLLNQILSAN